jgi:hypothetical protein
MYFLLVETLEPVRAPEVFAPDELILVVRPEYGSVVIQELSAVGEWLEAA